MLERTSLVVMSVEDGRVEICVGRQTRLVFSEPIAHHFAIKSMELLKLHAPVGTSDDANRERREQIALTAQKLIFYIAFTVRSRTQATAVSMRSMSMFMMLFMMMTIAATKQHQARRYAEIYGYDPYGRHALMYGGGGYPLIFGGRRSLRDEAFWDDFEMGRRGDHGMYGHRFEQHHHHEAPGIARHTRRRRRRRCGRRWLRQPR